MDNEANDEKYYNDINTVRNTLLKLADYEMINKLRNPTTKINSEFPRVVNYCKENNFCISLKENYCSSRVKFNENLLKNVTIKNRCKRRTTKKERSLSAISVVFSSKLINQLPNIPYCLQQSIDNNNFSNLAYNPQEANEWINKKMNSFNNFNSILTSSKEINKFSSLNNINSLNDDKSRKEASIGNMGNINNGNNGIDSPSIRKLKGMTKRAITKKSILTVDEILTSRNNTGAYLDDPFVFLRIKEGFIFIRSLPYIKQHSNKKTPENNLKIQEELEEFEETLLIKDNINETSAIKLKKIKEQTEGITDRNYNKNGFYSIQHKCLKNQMMLSPLKKTKNISNKGSNLFLLDLQSATSNGNFRLDFERLNTVNIINPMNPFERNNGLLTEYNRRGTDNYVEMELSSENNDSSNGDDENFDDYDLDSSTIVTDNKHKNKDIITMDDLFDVDGLNTIC